MTARELGIALRATDDADREIPIDLVLWMMDDETEERLMDFLGRLFLTSDDPAVRDEAMALIVRLTIP